jgi:hypothetical protein
LGAVLKIAKDGVNVETTPLRVTESDVVPGSAELVDTVGFEFKKAFSFVDEHACPPANAIRTILAILTGKALGLMRNTSPNVNQKP